MAILIIAVTLTARAQDMPPTLDANSCAAALERLWAAATAACANQPDGQVCNGGAPLQTDPGEAGAGLASVGSLAAIGDLLAVRTPRIAVENGSVGVAWLRRPAPDAWAGVLIGDVTLRDVSPEGFPAWQSFLMATAAEAPPCAAVPRAMLIVQVPRFTASRFVVNGVSLQLGGTVAIRDMGEGVRFIGLEGNSSVTALGAEQPLSPGQVVEIAHAPGAYNAPGAPPSAPIAFNMADVAAIPIPLLDRSFVLPQPGTANTFGAVNLRNLPSTDGAVITQVPAGETLSILGASIDGAWIHARRGDGSSGWMLEELIFVNAPPIAARYDQTPAPPQRYGDLAARGTIAEPGAALFTGPEIVFNAIVALPVGTPVRILARSPYSPWIKVELNGGGTGWVPVTAVRTAAYFDALPIDTRAPSPPTATPIPGSVGNAFPNPAVPTQRP